MSKDDRSSIGMKSMDTKGPTPGSTKAISQRKAISEGYEAAATPRRVHTNQPSSTTGKASAPGLMSRGGPRHKD